MKKPSFLVLILSLAIGVVYFAVVRFQIRIPADDSENSLSVQNLDSEADGDMDSLKQFVDEFYNLEPGHYSSVNATEFLAEINKDKSLSTKLAEHLQNDPSIAKRLLGLIIQLEVNGYTAESGQYALAQESILFGSATAKWLFLHQQFDAWSEFLDTFSFSMNEEKSKEFISYVFEPFGSKDLPAGFGLFSLGEVGQMEINWLLDRSNSLQRKLKDHLTTNNVSATERNKGLIALKKPNPGYFQETIEFFVNQSPPDSPTHKYLSHLRDSSTEYSIDALKPHLAEIEGSDSIENQQNQSVDVVLDAVLSQPTLPVDDAILKKLEDFLTKFPTQTQSLKLKIASIGYARWLAQSR